MQDKEILDHIKNSIEAAPIGLLGDLKEMPVAKMIKHDEITRQTEKRNRVRPIASLVAAAVFLIIFFNFQTHYILADGYVYLDVEPGVQITTNKQGEVIRVGSVNEEADALVNSIDYKGKDLYNVTEEIVDVLMANSYINEVDKTLLVSVYNKDDKKKEKQAEKLNREINKQLDAKDKESVLLTQALEKSDTKEKSAKKYGISPGKMALIQKMIKRKPDLKVEELTKLSTSELTAMAQRYEMDIDKLMKGNNGNENSNDDSKKNNSDKNAGNNDQGNDKDNGNDNDNGAENKSNNKNSKQNKENN